MYKQIFAIATDSAGDYSAAQHIGGPYVLHGLHWLVGTLGTAVSGTLSCTNTPSGVDYNVLTITNGSANYWYYPRPLECDEAGAALTTRTLPIVEGALNLAVAGAGSVTLGTAIAYLMLA